MTLDSIGMTSRPVANGTGFYQGKQQKEGWQNWRFAALASAQWQRSIGPQGSDSAGVLESVLNRQLWQEKTTKYYGNGWRLLSGTNLVSKRLDHIAKDDVDVLTFPFRGSAAPSVDCALRTLRRMLHKAEKWNLLIKVPRFKLLPEDGRKLRLDDDAEQKLLLAAESCDWKPAMFNLFRDVIILARDTGMWNGRELYRIRIEFPPRHWPDSTRFLI
jgi:hypothetical protein